MKTKYKTSNNNLSNEQNRTAKIKDNLNKKENEISKLKKQIEKLKENNNFKDGMFFTSIGAKGNTKNEKLDDMDVNIEEELAQIEQKYKMINEENEKEQKNIENSENKDKQKEEDKNNDKEKKDE